MREDVYRLSSNDFDAASLLHGLEEWFNVLQTEHDDLVDAEVSKASRVGIEGAK